MIPWRYIEEDQVSASYGLAADEYLMRAYEPEEEIKPPTLRLYTYRSHCALVGHFQEVETEIDVNYCRAANIPINRRPTGGGAIVMGNDQLGMALVASTRYPGVPNHPREIYALYSAGIRQGLEALGIQGALEGKNDIRVGGRKIAGLGLCRGNNRALLFHASLLVDLDIPLMLRVLKIAPEKLSDKIQVELKENLTTVRREVGWPISLSQVREIIRQGFESTAGVSFSPRLLNPLEEEGMRALEKEKYLDDRWIFQRRPIAATAGSSIQKTPGGLLKIYVSLNGRQIERVSITGDFFADGGSLKELEKQLTNIPAEESEVTEAIRYFFDSPFKPFQQVEERELLRGVMVALEEARRVGNRASGYGCFVNPGEGNERDGLHSR